MVKGQVGGVGAHPHRGWEASVHILIAGGRRRCISSARCNRRQPTGAGAGSPLARRHRHPLRRLPAPSRPAPGPLPRRRLLRSRRRRRAALRAAAPPRRGGHRPAARRRGGGGPRVGRVAQRRVRAGREPVPVSLGGPAGGPVRGCFRVSADGHWHGVLFVSEGSPFYICHRRARGPFVFPT
jgi:hypothetical protein